MLRFALLPALLLGTALLATAGPAAAEDTTLRSEVDALKARAEALEGQRRLLFEHEIRAYMDRTEALRSAQGGDGLSGVSLSASATAVGLATLGADPGNTHSVHGDVDLDFDFTVTDNLDLFIYLTANTNESEEFNSPLAQSIPSLGPDSFPGGFGPIAGSAGATLSGLFDGIGVDGTVSPHPGSVRVREAGIRWATPVGDRTLHVMLGKLDPRNYFAQNRFANDENTQFLNNLFDDPPAISWPTNASGVTVYGLHLWMMFGEREQYRFDMGWYNEPGMWLNDGIFLWQFAWTGQLQGREIQVRIYGQIDTVPQDPGAALGVSADWFATEKVGVFIRITVHDNQPISEGEYNNVESDWQLGAQVNGLLPSRPDDTFGIAWGLIKGPIRAALGGATENSEQVIEIYYRYMAEEGKLQITPLVQFILDPGAGTFTEPDSLIILGLRIHVPF